MLTITQPSLFSYQRVRERSNSVGYSDHRTPCKHAVLKYAIEREAFAAVHVASKFPNRFPDGYKGMAIYDLCAGDGVAGAGREWHEGSSPGILAALATHPKARVNRITLWEKTRATFANLNEGLTAELPLLGYVKEAECKWSHRRTGTQIIARRGDSSVEDFSGVAPGEFVFINNDPNHISHWALDAEAAFNLASRNFVKIFCTMGCNPGGTKRGIPFDERKKWFDLVEGVCAVARKRDTLDVLLFQTLGDSGQWGYLVLEPSVWAAKTTVTWEQIFKSGSLNVTGSSLRTSKDKFDAILDRLFRTKKERGVK